MTRLLALLAALLVVPTALAQTLSREEVGQRVAGALALTLQEERPDLHVTAVISKQELSLPDGEVGWQTGVDLTGWQPGTVIAPVIVRVDGREVTFLELPVTLVQRMQLPVLREALPRGVALQPELLELREVTLTHAVPDLVVSGDELVGLVAGQAMRPGQPLSRKAFVQPIAVRRGDLVRVRALQGGLTVETKAVAMHTGQMGDVITMRNTKSFRNFSARVSGPGEVTVETP